MVSRSVVAAVVVALAGAACGPSVELSFQTAEVAGAPGEATKFAAILVTAGSDNGVYSFTTASDDAAVASCVASTPQADTSDGNVGFLVTVTLAASAAAGKHACDVTASKVSDPKVRAAASAVVVVE